MTGALIEFDRKSGRVTSVCLIADSEEQQAIAEYGLARIAKPSVWWWFSSLFRRRPSQPLTKTYGPRAYRGHKVDL